MSKRTAKVLKVNNPTFTYTSTCCGEAATKPPCTSDRDAIKEGGRSESTLGHWRCLVCKKPCKVTRSKNKEKE